MKAAQHETRWSSPIVSTEINEVSSSMQQPDGSLLHQYHLNAFFCAM